LIILLSFLGLRLDLGFCVALKNNEEEKMLKMAIAESIKSAEEHSRTKDSSW